MRISARDGVSRVTAGRKVGLAAAVGTFGLPATAVSIAGFAGIPVLLGLGALSIVVGLCTAYTKGRGQILPKNLIDEARNIETPYACGFCTETSLAEACDLTKPHYRDEYVASEQAELWRQKNPKGFVQLLNKDGELSASFGVIALTKSFTDQFFKGNVADLNLKDFDVLDFKESKRASKLYISGVVVRDPDTHLGRKRTAVMLWVMVCYLEKLYGVRKKRTLYAIAVTEVSKRLLENLGFEIACDAKHRQDRYHLYHLELTPESWKALKAHVRAFGDSSAICKYSF